MSSGVSACRFAVGSGCLQGMAAWPHGVLSPDWCLSRASGRRVKDRAEPGRRGGAAGVLDAPGRRADNGLARGKARQAAGAGYAVVRRPIAGGAAGQARWLPSSLRVSPAWLAGGHGAVRVRAGRGQSQRRPRRRAAGAGAGGGQTSQRPRARPGPAQVMRLPGWMARRTCPSRIP